MSRFSPDSETISARVQTGRSQAEGVEVKHDASAIDLGHDRLAELFSDAAKDIAECLV